jgi:hypothetical protein
MLLQIPYKNVQLHRNIECPSINLSVHTQKQNVPNLGTLELQFPSQQNLFSQLNCNYNKFLTNSLKLHP